MFANSQHDLPCHGTMTKCLRQVSQSKVVFLSHQQRCGIQTYFCNCLQYLCLLDILFECIPNKHGQGTMSVRPNRLRSIELSTSNQCFVSCQPIFMSSTHTQIRRILFHDVRISIPNWKPSPNRISIGFARIAFPIIVLPKDDRKNFAHVKRIGLPRWTMI